MLQRSLEGHVGIGAGWLVHGPPRWENCVHHDSTSNMDDLRLTHCDLDVSWNGDHGGENAACALFRGNKVVLGKIYF